MSGYAKIGCYGQIWKPESLEELTESYRFIQPINLVPTWPIKDLNRKEAMPGTKIDFNRKVIIMMNTKSAMTITIVLFPGLEQANFSPNRLKEIDSSGCLFALMVR